MTAVQPIIPNAQRITLPTGVTLNVYQAGTGPDVLLLHGTAGGGMLWSVQIAQLVAAGFRVTSPDGRGHGLSDRAKDYSTAAIVADAVALIKALDLHKPIVIGHSMGGVQALSMAIKHNELLTCAILVDPALLLEPRDDAYVKAFRAAWRHDLDTWSPMSFADLVAFKKKETPSWSDEVITQWAHTKLQIDPDVLQWLDELRVPIWSWVTPTDVPIHMMYCQDNAGGVVTPALIKELRVPLPFFSAAVVPKAGHYMYLDNPEGFMRAVKSYLNTKRLLP